MARYVADHYARLAIAELEELVEIAADALGWNNARRHLCFRSNAVGRRKQLHLQVVREIHLLQQPLAIEGSANEPRVLNRRPNLRGDSGDELLIAGGEWLARATIGKVHDAKRLSAGGSGPHDRNGRHLTTSVRRLTSESYALPDDDQRMLGAKDSRRHAADVVSADRQNLLLGHAKRGDSLQRVGARVVHEDRRYACANRLRDLGEDRRRRILQCSRPSENLPNGVKEVDLLVSLGELGRCVFYFERGLRELRDDRHQQLDVPLLRRVGRVARADGQPDFLW